MLSKILLSASLAYLIGMRPAVAQDQMPAAGAVEICDNQIDDDNDGYVDCYDSDCQCFSGEDCSVTELETDFRVRLAWQSAQNGPSITAIPVVANMNPQQDSLPEIIVAAAAPNGASNPNKILFFRGDGSNLNNPMTLTVPGGFDSYPVPGPTIGDIDRDGRPELIMSCRDNRLRVFRNYTENPTAPMSLWITSSGQLDQYDQKPYLADFDGDGIPEIYAGSDIFSFNLSNPGNPTLNKVINGPAYTGQAYYGLYQEGSCSPTAVDLLSVADCNGDPDCAGLELVAGPMIYSIDLNPNDGDGYQVKVKRDLNQIKPGNGFDDGYTAVADVDLDGVLDIVVSARRSNQSGVYIWNKNGFLGFLPYPSGNTRSGSLACIANLFDDRTAGFAEDFPEIVVCNAYNLNCFNLHAAQLNPAAPYWWSLPTKDYSGFTGSTTYDFNGDGIFELVYRDEDNFRILYGGAPPFPAGVDSERNWFKIPCGSLTSDEYPVVADVDNDGETEIAVTGYTFSGYNSPSSDYRGRLRVFESDAEPWVPCRNVWNQFNYFVVNVADDLSIPVQQQLHHLELPAAGSGNRPLNRYLSQRQLLDENFLPFLPVPDALATVQQVLCNQDVLDIELQVCNSGSHKLPAGTPVAFYQGDPTSTDAQLLGAVQPITANVAPDSCTIFHFSIPRTPGTLFGVVNDNGAHARPFNLAADFPVTSQVECNYPNNIFHFNFAPGVMPFDIGPNIATCSDTAIVLNAGAGHLAYQWQDGSTDSIFHVKSPGQYWVSVSDHCQLDRADTVLVEVYGNPQIHLDTINGNCFGQQGVATVSANSLALPLHVQWSTGSTELMLSGMPDGIYTVTVTDANGCLSADSTWVEAGGWLQAETAISEILCFGQTGTIQVLISAGRAPFDFIWSDNSGESSLQDVPAGDYSVTVTDADGCQQIVETSLSEPPPLISQGIIAEPACPGEANGAAHFLGALQGVPPYSILWSIDADVPDVTDLATGLYALTVTDANGCTLEQAVQVPEFIVPDLDTLVMPVSCFGADNGSISVELTGGSPGYGFLWSTGSNSAFIGQLAPGLYALTYTYAGGECTGFADFSITQPPDILLGATGHDPLCAGGIDGSIDLQATGGEPPFLYAWSSGSSSKDLTGLSAGNYTVTVIDAAACTRVLTLALDQPLPLLSNGYMAEAACPNTANGSLHFSGAGQGSPPYQYLWSTGAAGPDISGLTSGMYTLTITDSHGCSLAETVEVPAFIPPEIQPTILPITCYGLENGEIAVALTGGSPGFAFSWSNGATAPELQNLAPGNYRLTLTYADGKCVRLMDFQITTPSPVALSKLTHDPLCAGGLDGNIELSSSGGTPPYSFFWSNGAQQDKVSGLPAGAYTVTVTDTNGCSESLSALLNEPPAMVLADMHLTPARCFGDASGGIAISPQGGVAPYLYIWSNGQSTPAISGLLSGTYSLTLTDAHDCPLTAEFTVSEPEKIEIQPVIQPDTCKQSTGAIALSISGGVAPYGYSWINGALTPDISELTAGPYEMTLTDANGCMEAASLLVPALGEDPVPVPFTDVITCAQPYAEIGVETVQNNLVYSWSGPAGVLSNQRTHTVSVPGFYQVTVTNVYGCQGTASLDVAENRIVPFAEAGADSIQVPCNVAGILLDANGSSIGPNYTNHWLLIENGMVVFDTAAIRITAKRAGLYIHDVYDLTNGCAARDSVRIDWIEPILAALRVDSISCFGSDDGVISIENISGGAPPLFYSIDNQHLTSTPVFSGLPPGEYQISVRDNQGCLWETMAYLDEPDALSVDLMASDSILELGQALHLTAHPTPAGVALRDVVWEPSGRFNFLPRALQQTVWPKESAEFSVTIVDNHGCLATDRLSVRVDNNNIYVPNVIYPGSDQNGWFTIFSGDGVNEIRVLRIFDRWGNQVFENKHFPTSELAYGWDGSFRNEALNPGVFAWYAELELRNGRVVLLKGDVTVIR